MKTAKNNIINGFKATDKDLKCRGFQYAVGEIYEHDGSISLCNSGFHFCQNPLDVLDFYDLCDSEFLSVEAHGAYESDDKKTVTNKLKVTASIGLPGLIKASVEWIINSTKKSKKKDSSQLAASGYYSKLAASGDYSKLAASGDYSKLAASGYYSQLAASGYYSQLAASGDYSKLAASGDYSKLAASGYYSKLAASGYYSKLAASGDYSKLAASGDSSQLAASGYYSKLAASGYYSKLAASGDYSKLAASGDSSIAAGIGVNNTAKAKKGSWIVLAEWKYDNKINRWKPVCVLSAQVDGETIKEDTYYKVTDGSFVEVGE